MCPCSPSPGAGHSDDLKNKIGGRYVCARDVCPVFPPCPALQDPCKDITVLISLCLHRGPAALRKVACRLGASRCLSICLQIVHQCPGSRNYSNSIAFPLSKPRPLLLFTDSQNAKINVLDTCQEAQGSHSTIGFAI